MVKETCIPFDAILRFYNPLEKTWVLRTTTKVIYSVFIGFFIY